MALIQWCNGLVSFLAAPLAAGFKVPCYWPPIGFGSNPMPYGENVPYSWCVRGRTPVGYGRVSRRHLSCIRFDS